MTKPPVLIDGFALLFGYFWAAIRRMERPVSHELMRFHRREQMKKLSGILGALLKFKKVDSFHLVAEQSDQKSDVRRHKSAAYVETSASQGGRPPA
jgi:hypothetical protein